MTIERIKETFSTAKLQFAGFEKRFEEVEKRAKESFDEVPAQLRGAWEHVVTRLRGTLDFASRAELLALTERVDELAKHVDRLLRGEKIRHAAASKEKSHSKHA